MKTSIVEAFLFLIVKSISWIISLNGKLMPKNLLAAGVGSRLASGRSSVEVKGERFRFKDAGKVTQWRVRKAAKLEPMTVNFASNCSIEDIFFDIGANIGFFSMLAARSGAEVFSFELEPSNVRALFDNAYLNDASLNIIPIGLSDKNALFATDFAGAGVGGSLNRLVREGEGRAPRTISITLDTLYKANLIPVPTKVKLDVDGLEPNIIKGGQELLSDAKCREVLVEMDLQDHESMAETACLLAACGFDAREKFPISEQFQMWHFAKAAMQS